MLIVGRFLSGLICGLFSGLILDIIILLINKNNVQFKKGLVPLYLNEISPLNLRSFTGTLSAMFIVMISHQMKKFWSIINLRFFQDSGILAVNICGLVLGTDSLWPLLFVLTIVISSINLGLFFAVER